MPKKQGKNRVKTPAKVPAVVGELQQVEGAIANIDKVGAGIKALQQKYAGAVYDVATGKGMAEARAARHEIRQPRYKVEEIRKAAKKPLLELGRRLDAEAKRIESELLAIEDPIDAQIKAEEQRVENERQAAVEKERQRIEGINRRIDGIRTLSAIRAGETAASLAERLKAAEATTFEGYDEYEAEARAALTGTLALLATRRERLVSLEQEQERLRKQREEQDAREAALHQREARLQKAIRTPENWNLPPAPQPGTPDLGAAGTPDLGHAVGSETPPPYNPPRLATAPHGDWRPTEAELVDVLEEHYNTVGRQTIIGWLWHCNWDKAGVASAKELENEHG